MVTKVSNKLGTEAEVREFIKLAFPIAGAQIAQAAASFVDKLMMGNCHK